MGREPTPRAGEEVEKTVRELPHNPQVIAFYKKRANGGPLPQRKTHRAKKLANNGVPYCDKPGMNGEDFSSPTVVSFG